LLLANGLFFAWDHELLRGLGLGPALQGEPHRLDQQISPDAVQLLTAEEFKHIEEQVKMDQTPAECLQAGPFDAAQVLALRQALGHLLPAESWELHETAVAARWIVYMGKYPNHAALLKKRAQVAAMKINIESLVDSSLEPGFSLGAFDTKADADSALASLAKRGVHTAHVVQERAARTDYQLVLPKVRAALKPKVVLLGTALVGNSLHACK
jgi:hypothetical protein